MCFFGGSSRLVLTLKKVQILLGELFARSQMLKVEFGKILRAHGGWTR